MRSEMPEHARTTLPRNRHPAPVGLRTVARIATLLLVCGCADPGPTSSDAALADFEISLQRLLDESSAPDGAYLALNAAVDVALATADDPDAMAQSLEDAAEAALETAESQERLSRASAALRGAFVSDDPDLSPLAAARVAQAGPDAIVVYVNGLWTTAVKAAENRGFLRRAIAKDPRLAGVSVGGYYNRSFVESCAVQTSVTWLKPVTLLFTGLNCVVAIAQDLMVGLFANFCLPSQDEDVADFASFLRGVGAQDRKIIIVAHSDGNHVVRDALKALRTNLVPGDAELATAIGLVMVGSPIRADGSNITGALSGSSGEKVAWIGLACDPVAWLAYPEPWVDLLRLVDVSLGTSLGPSLDAILVLRTTLCTLDAVQILEREAALSQLGDALGAVLDVLFGPDDLDDLAHLLPNNLPDGFYRNPPLKNFHFFTSNYMAAGTVTRTLILDEISRLRGTLLPPSGAPAPRALEVGLGTASGTFGTTGGLFQVAVTPMDTQGQYVGEDFPITAFRFENVRLTPEGGGPGWAVSAKVTGVVNEPAEAGSLTAVMVFDSSGSMTVNDPAATGRLAGANAFLDELRTGDEVAVTDFGGLNEIRLLQAFTTDQVALRASLDLLTESGSTPLYEAVLDGLQRLEDRIGSGGALLVLTDGQTSGSVSVSAAIAQAKLQSTPVFAVGLGASIPFGDLRDLGTETGGGFAEASDSDALEETFRGVSLGITLGRVNVHGEGVYGATVPLGRYRVTGILVTNDPKGAITETFFRFTVDIG